LETLRNYGEARGGQVLDGKSQGVHGGINDLLTGDVALITERLVAMIGIIPRVASPGIDNVMNLEIALGFGADDAPPIIALQDMEPFLLPLREAKFFGVSHN